MIESMASLTILILALGLVMAGYLFTLKNNTIQQTQDEIDQKLRISLERLKKDLRLSSQDQIFCYPAGSGPYQAISFPIARDDDGDGLLEKDANGYIIWDDTIIYHVVPSDSGASKLVKSSFSPRDSSLTTPQRIEQLKDVVETGTGTSTYNSANASSKVLFENLMKWNITIDSAKFDAYNPIEERQYIDLGYHLLDSGIHKFKFTAIGKNDSSSGYKIGFDQLWASLSQSDREAETQNISSSGATPIKELMHGYGGDYEGGYRLWFPAKEKGNSITFLMDNDRWEETNFTDDTRSYVLDNTISTWDTNLLDNVIKLEGNDFTWDADLQTFSKAIPSSSSLPGSAIRIIAKGAELWDNGGWIRVNGKKCRLVFEASNSNTLEVQDAFIGESQTNINSDLIFDSSTITPVKFGGSSSGTTSGGVLLSDWVDLEIDKEKNYIICFRIPNDIGKSKPAIWINQRGDQSATCLIATNGVPANTKDTSWSHLSSSIISTNALIGLSSIFASYAESGSYESPIFDTGLITPHYKDITWNTQIPLSGTLNFRIRSGDKNDLSDASSWESLTTFSSPRSANTAYKRYVQFQALMTANNAGTISPILRDVTIDWTGEKRVINIAALVTVGPECGIYELTVDGQQLISTLSVDLKVYEDIYTGKGNTRRVESRMKLDIHPRNTGF